MLKADYGTENVEKEGYGSRQYSIFEGHLGIKKTKDRIQTNFYWPGLQGDVTSFCRSCDVCQKTTAQGSVPHVPLGDMPLIDMPFRKVAVDLAGPISSPSKKGH